MSEEKKKSCCCRKILKFVLWTLAGLTAFVLLAAATLPLWISPVATRVAGFVVPKYTGTPFKIDRFHVNPWNGALRVAGVELSNPKGFDKCEAFSVKSFSVDMDVKDLFSNRLHIKNIEVDGTFASYFSHNRKNNFEVIMDNVNQALGSEDAAEEKKTKEPKPETSGGDEMKLLIDRIRIAGTSVKITESDLLPPLPIMTIELKDIGKDSGGVKFGDAGKVIADALMKAMNSAGGGLNALGSSLGEGIGKMSKSVKDIGDAADKSAKKISTAFETAGNSTVSAVNSVGEGAKATVNTVGDGAKAAIDAVGNTTKKAAEDIKNLFKGIGK